MKSLLQPYIEKQILLEDEESEKNSAKAKGNMYVLVWDVLNSQGITSGFAHKLSDYISKIIAGKKPNPPSSKNLKSSEVKNLVSYGETIAQKWHGWDWKKNPPTPVSASWEDTWGGGRTSYNWGGMPSEKATPANMVDVYGSDSEKHISKLDGYDEVVNKDEPASTIEPEEPEQDEPDSREEHSSEEQQAVLKAKREIRNEFDDYKWKNWGGSAVAQQMSSWSGSAEKRPALEKEIRDMLALFGPTKTLITGDDATKIKSGKISDFKKVFMQIGEKPVPEIEKDPVWTTWMWNEIKHFADNEKYAVRLMDRDILEDFLEDKSKSLYINTASGEDNFFWENEPSAGGGQIDKSTVNRDTILSKETDPMKYVPGILAWAEKPDQRQKLHTWMKKQVNNPNHNAKFKLGGEQIPANIFYDRNYVNAHWQDWAKNYDPGLGKVEPYKHVPAQNDKGESRDFDEWKREEDAGVAAWKDKYGKTHNWKDGSVKVKMPIWDKVGSKWKPNNSGASPLEQPDMKKFIRLGGVEKGPGAMQQDADDDSDKSVAILMLSLLGFAAGPIGAGVASSIASVSTKLTAQGIAAAGLGWLGIHYAELSDEQKQDMALRSSMFVSNLRTSFQYQNDDYYDKFLNDIGDTGSLFSRMVEKNPKLTADQLVNFRRTLDVSGTLMHSGGPTENIDVANINVENNTSFMRSALDLLNEEEPIVPIDLTSGVEIMSDISASDEQIRDANSVLDAMGMTNWTFVQPKDNTKTQASGNKGASTGAGAYIDVDEDGKISVKQYQDPVREPGKEDKGSEMVAQAEVSSHVAALQVMKEIERLGRKHGYAPPVTQIVAAVEKGVGAVDQSIINKMENPPDEMCEWWWKPGTDEKEIKGTGGPSPGSGWMCKAYKRDDDAIDNLNQAVTKRVDKDPKVVEWTKNKEKNSIAKVFKDDEPASPIEDEGLTPEQIKAIIRRLSKNGQKSGPRDPNIAWNDNLQKILKIGANGSTADFKKRWKEVADIVTNSTSPTPPIETLDSVGASVVKAGTPMKMYDDALKSGPGAEIMQQVLDSDPNFAKIWNARKSKTFKLPGHVAIFYYFGWPIQVAVDDKEYVALKKKETEAKPEASTDDAEEQQPETQVSQPDPTKYSIKITQNPRGKNDRWPEVINVIDPSGKVVKSWQPKNNREPKQFKIAAQDYVNKMNAQASAGSTGGSIDAHFINVLGKEKYEIWKKVTGALSNNEKICVLAMMKKGFDLRLRPATESVQLDEGVIWDSWLKPLVKVTLTHSIKNLMTAKTYRPGIDLIKNWSKMSDDQVVAFLRNAKKTGQTDNWLNMGDGFSSMRKDAIAFAKTASKGASKGVSKDASKGVSKDASKGAAKAASIKAAKDASIQGKAAGKNAASGTLTKVKDLIKKHPKKAGAAGAYGAWKLFFDKNEELDCDVATLIHKIQQAGGDLVNSGNVL